MALATCQPAAGLEPYLAFQGRVLPLTPCRLKIGFFFVKEDNPKPYSNIRFYCLLAAIKVDETKPRPRRASFFVFRTGVRILDKQSHQRHTYLYTEKYGFGLPQAIASRPLHTPLGKLGLNYYLTTLP